MNIAESSSAPPTPSTGQAIKDMILATINELVEACPTHEPFVVLKNDVEHASVERVIAFVGEEMAEYRMQITKKDYAYFLTSCSPVVEKLKLADANIPEQLREQTFSTLAQVLMMQTYMSFVPPELLQTIESAAGKVMSSSSANGQIDPLAIASAMTDLLGSMGLGSAMQPGTPETRVSKLKEARKKLI